MDTKPISCPKCGTAIDLSAAMTATVRADITAGIEQTQAKLMHAKLTEQAQQLEQQYLAQNNAQSQAQAGELSVLKQQLAAQAQQTKAAQENERKLRTEASELESRAQALDLEVARRLEQQLGQARAKFNAELEKQHATAKQLQSSELAEMKQQLALETNKAKEAQANELKLRAQASELEGRAQALDLEVARKLEHERGKISHDLRQQLQGEHDLKLKQREQQIDSLRTSLSDAKRKAEQGSQETQGEALEISLEDTLRQQFPQDDFQSISKGVRGGDVLQTVKNSQFQACGKILWETKNTKSWSGQWPQKLKDDLRAANAQIPVLVSASLPPSIKRFGQLEGVWVSDIQAYAGVAGVLRQQLIEVEFVRAANRGQQGKTEIVYEYLIGDGFRSKIEAIVEAFDAMEMQLIKERRAMEKQWREREQIIRRLTTNTVGMYGEIKGIVGATLPEIKALELDDE